MPAAMPRPTSPSLPGPSLPGLTNEPSTRELVNQVKSGDVRAWLAVDSRYRRRLALLIRGRIPKGLRSRFDTDDVVQSTIIQAYRELDSFEDDGTGSFHKWIGRILENRFYSRVRFHRSRLRDTRAEASDVDLQGLQDAGTSMWVKPTDAETAEAVASVIDQLSEQPEEENFLIRRRFFDGLTFRELAAEVGTSEATARRRVAAALLRLRYALKPLEQQ